MRKSVKPVVTATLAVLALLFASAARAGAATVPTSVNKVVVTNTTSNSSAFKLGFAESVNGASRAVTAVNNATAVTSTCLHCKTVAIAFQIVFAGPGAVVHADNRAFALEVRCVECSNLAMAYQFIVLGGPPSLPTTMQPEFDSAHKELEALRSSSLSIDATQQQVDGIAEHLSAVVRDQLSASGALRAATQNPGAAPTLTVHIASDKK